MSKALQYGDYRPLWTEHTQLFAYSRSLKGETYTIVCNTSGEATKLPQITSGAYVLENEKSTTGAHILP